MRSRKLLILILVVLAFAVLMPEVSEAANLRGDVELTAPEGGDLLPGGDVFNSETDVRESIIFSRVIPFAIRWLINFAIGISVIAFIIGGYQFMTSYGNTESRDKAIKTVTYAAIGLVLSLTAFGVVQIVTNISFT